MSGPRVWVDENDLRVVIGVATLLTSPAVLSEEARRAVARIAAKLDPPKPPSLRPYRARMQGHGA